MFGYLIQLAAWFGAQLMELFTGLIRFKQPPSMRSGAARTQTPRNTSHDSGGQVPVRTERLTLKLPGSENGTERMLLIYRGDITTFIGDAIVNTGESFDANINGC
jgi:hypothetical protein